MRTELHNADCLDVLRAMPAESVSAVVTDPPYAVDMDMGKGWDQVLPPVDIWRECLRVLKPGGMLLAFCASRTFPRMVCQIEDVGFEVRDVLMWLYGTGFPKSLAIDKAIDRMRIDRPLILEVTAWLATARDAAGLNNKDIDTALGFNGMASHWTSQLSQPAVPRLDQIPDLLRVLGNPEVPPRVAFLFDHLNGRKGTAGEDWAKREVVGTRTAIDLSKSRPVSFAAQGLETAPKREIDVTTAATDKSKPWQGYGTCLKPAYEPIALAMKPLAPGVNFARNALRHGVAGLNLRAAEIPGETPRWPANVVTDGAEDLPAEVLRFYYSAKASKRDRDSGLPVGTVNAHPTVKPVDLMRWLVRMVKMPGEATTILDPFMGSGTTGVAAILEDVGFVGIERDPAFYLLADLRILGHHRRSRVD